MTPPQDDTMWRNRFILINLVRIGGTVLTLLAILLWQSDMFVEGGSWVGFPLALGGLVASFFGPRYLARRWRTPPSP
ncbi:MAG TPA: hypothetical protein VEW04_08020 [Allosphingosinicella sp.]|nr:hypothetical protein [Allosphingosinicella sp.]